jgi:hypothetical protein
MHVLGQKLKGIHTQSVGPYDHWCWWAVKQLTDRVSSFVAMAIVWASLLSGRNGGIWLVEGIRLVRECKLALLVDWAALKVRVRLSVHTIQWLTCLSDEIAFGLGNMTCRCWIKLYSWPVYMVLIGHTNIRHILGYAACVCKSRDLFTSRPVIECVSPRLHTTWV